MRRASKALRFFYSRCFLQYCRKAIYTLPLSEYFSDFLPKSNNVPKLRFFRSQNSGNYKKKTVSAGLLTKKCYFCSVYQN